MVYVIWYMLYVICYVVGDVGTTEATPGVCTARSQAMQWSLKSPLMVIGW